MRGISENVLFFFPLFLYVQTPKLLYTSTSKHFHDVTDEVVHKTYTKTTNVTIPAQRVNARRRLPFTHIRVRISAREAV